MPLADDSVYVLLPLGAQRGKHFAEKFTSEDPNMFWNKDEKQIVSFSLCLGEGLFSCMSGHWVPVCLNLHSTVSMNLIRDAM